MVNCGITVYVLATIGMAKNGCAKDSLATLQGFRLTSSNSGVSRLSRPATTDKLQRMGEQSQGHRLPRPNCLRRASVGVTGTLGRALER
jgi:hypothetical protein